MSAPLVISVSIAVALGFILLSYLVGRALPESWFLAGPAQWLQAILAGFFIEVCVLRLPFRYEYPEWLGYGLVAALAAAGLYRSARQTAAPFSGLLRTMSWRRILGLLSWSALVFLPGLVILFAPLVLSHALTWQNYGPDYDGYLITASYLADHHTFADLTRAFMDASGSSHWWDFKAQAWNIPDIRTLLGVEFFLRALRFGHAVLSVMLMKIFHVPLWLAFHCLCVFSFIVTPLVIAEAGLRRGIPRGLLAAGIVIIIGSQNYILMMYEGITIQLIITPILLFLTLNWRQVLLEQKSLGQKLFLAIVLSGLISTFGEAVQIAAMFFFVCLLVAWFFGGARPARANLLDILQITGLTVLVEPTIALDFLFWTYRRAREGFFGGALHGHWSVLSLLLSVPTVTIHPFQPPYQLVASNYFVRVLEACVVIAAGFYARRWRRQAGTDLLVVGSALLIFCLAGNNYVIWKIAVILQPLAVLAILGLLPERVFALPSLLLVRAYACIVFACSMLLIGMYWHRTVPMRLEQFATDRRLTRGRSVAIVTPSTNRVYLRLGATGEDFWSNSPARTGGANADFHLGHRESLPIALYFDCDAEGPARCAAIKGRTGTAIPERTLVPAQMRIGAFLRADGSVDPAKLNAYVLDRFGVPAQ